MAPYLRKHPFFLVSLFFIAGISTADLFQCSVLYTYAISGGFVLLVFGLYLLRQTTFIGIFQSVLILFIFYFLGVNRTQQQWIVNQSNHYAHFLQSGTNTVIGEIREINRERCLLLVEQINGMQSVGKLTISTDCKLIAGDRIFAKMTIEEIAGPKNPFQFDYKRFNHYRQIWYQAKLDGQPLILTSEHHLKIWFHRLRDRCENYFRQLLTTDNEYALVCALVLGDKREMGETLRNAYADTGTMHVLAVSGLHVGVVYLLLSFLFRNIFSMRFFWRVSRSILILAGLWFFVFLVGSPVSALRAALMFCLMELGLLASRNYYPVNTLSLAAFILLLIDPNGLYDVGFQLSFLAVLGIVTCQREIQNWWVVEHPLGFRIWQMTSLSFAAQVFTFPLTIYYFHQFPLYFWLSGLLAVPMAFLVLALGLLNLILLWIPVIHLVLGYLLLASAFLLNSWIFIVQLLPGIVLEHIWMNQWQLFSLLIFSVIFSFYLNRRTYVFRCLLVASLVIFLTMTNIKKWNTLNRVLLVGYYDRYKQYADLVVGSSVYPLHGQQLEEKVPLGILNARIALGAREVVYPDYGSEVFNHGGFWAFGHFRIYFQDSIFHSFLNFPEIDAVFIKQPFDMRWIEDMPRDVELFLLNPGNTANVNPGELLDSLGFEYYDIKRDGAVIRNISK